MFSQNDKQASQRRWTDMYHEGDLWQQMLRKKGDKEEVDETSLTSGFMLTLNAPTLTCPKQNKKKHQILGIQMRY